MAYAREAESLENAASMEQKHRRRLAKRMTLFQQELAKLPELQRLRLSSMLSEKLIATLSDIHVAAVTINGAHAELRAGTPEMRKAAAERAEGELDDVLELYGI